jgi:hypothetical protein
MTMTTIKEKMTDIAITIERPAYVSEVSVLGRSFRFQIANHTFPAGGSVGRHASIDAAVKCLVQRMCDISDRQVAIAVGKTITPCDTSYGWSNLDELANAGVSIISNC